MLKMVDDGAASWQPGGLSAVDGYGGGNELDGGDHMSIDIDMLFGILEENSDHVQGNQEDLSCKNLSLQGNSAPDAGNPEKSQFHGSQVFDGALSLEADYQSYNLEASDTRTGGSSGSFGYHGKLKSSAQISSPAHTCSASFKDWYSLGQGAGCAERVGVSHFEMPSCSTASSFVERDGTLISDHGDNVGFNLMESEAGIQFRHARGGFDSKYAFNRPVTVNSDVKHEYCGNLSGNRLETLQDPENSFPGSTVIPFMDADMSSHNVTSTESTICHNSDVISDFSDHYSSMSYCLHTDDMFFADSSPCYISSDFNFHFFPSNEDIMNNIKDEIVEFPTESACSSTRMVLNTQGRGDGGSISEVSMIDYSDVKGQNLKCEDSSYASLMCGNSLSNADGGFVDDKASSQQFIYNQLSMLDKKQTVYIKDERDDLVASRSRMCRYDEVIDELICSKSYYSADDEAFVAEDTETCLPGVLPSTTSQMPMVHAKDDKEDMITAYERVSHCQDIIDRNGSRIFIDTGHLNSNASEQCLPNVESITLSKRQLGCVAHKGDGTQIESKVMDFHLSKVSPESIHSNSSDCRSHIDDDPDICIIDDISQPACPNRSQVLAKPAVAAQHFSDSLHYSGVGGMRLKPNDERLIFRVALQDLSQPKSEANPPDGVLAVSLLRHQRIALSWMVHKETASLHCSGGILADDQGLGKTISTIALILKERPSSSRACLEDAGNGELETLNLDDDDDDNDDGAPQLNGVKQESDCSHVMSNGSSMKSNPLGQAKGRPAAGTLIVCPTSVLRQWADELHNKVTNKANLSVLVYHGTNRTKDPCELAKYDVVITTYSIVSMEVPKQPLVDSDDDEKRKLEGYGASSMGFSSNKKRKYPPSSDKKGSKHKKGVDLLLESVARPLARVGWFRVVLDEAQSIKNHRTQVARACWGLRAKRRWCLSGTPIQNAIDDLYSYFRFLRYEPYAVYKLFCSTIKVPITRNPTKGYKKLQAVLKTIMLRRTKGTLLDGEPIISLPPKTVELKKVDFTKEERDFYSRLESDSRDQFKEYAEAGTVKQNYVNILLMLLRLRQACDHPLLVKGFDSNSLLKSSVDMAKKLPREKQTCLLNCLEASLAICGICNDPPEDAVVSVCGHVFCKQCICEHLTGDDNQCPTSNCKIQLSVSSVFSKATLNRSLFEMPGQDSSVYCSELVEAVQPSFEGCSYDSSKIKAALEVLQSLAQPRNHTLANNSLQNSFDGNDTCPENSSDLNAGDTLSDMPDKRNLNADKCLGDSVKVVGEKAIVFSQWTRMLDLLEACLKSSSIQYRRLDGTMSVVARDKAVKDFNTLPEVSVIIMSLKAASLGLNMVAACHVLLLDLWWNPTTEDQAIDRAHRIGQTRPVTVLRLTVKDTVEDRILALQQKKREMVASAFGEDETGSRQTRLTVEDLKYLFMV